jgi:hypothetical protein
MRILALALAATLLTSEADAAILKYEYSNIVGCWDGCYDDQTGDLTYKFKEKWLGSFLIDEALLPGGTVADTTFDMAWAYDSETNKIVATQIVSNAFGSLQFVRDYPSYAYLDWTDGGLFSPKGILGEFLALTVGDGEYRFSTNGQKDIVSWSGGNMGGGSWDPYTNSDGTDGRDWGPRSDGPGTWTKQDVSPIPLPAAGIGLLSSVLLLVGMRARKRART